jgi:hypothetical protein
MKAPKLSPFAHLLCVQTSKTTAKKVQAPARTRTDAERFVHLNASVPRLAAANEVRQVEAVAHTANETAARTAASIVATDRRIRGELPAAPAPKVSGLAAGIIAAAKKALTPL